MKESHLEKVQYEMKSLCSSVNWKEFNIWNVRRKGARQISETWKKCNMMVMNSFWVMVDRRKAINHISKQHNCQRFSPFANLPHSASRIWTCAEPGSRICWIKLYITNNHYTGVPQMKNSQRNSIWKECNMKKLLLEKSTI